MVLGLFHILIITTLTLCLIHEENCSRKPFTLKALLLRSPFRSQCLLRTMATADSRQQAFFARVSTPVGSLGVSPTSFVPQPPDLLLRLYVYTLGFGLLCNLTRRLASYQVSVRTVSVRRLVDLATPLPSPRRCRLRLAVRYAWR